MRGYDKVKEIFIHDERIEKEYYDFLTMDVLNRCGSSNYFLLATESWVFSHPLIKAVPLDINETLPFGVIHSKKPSEQVKKFLRIVDFVNLEYKNFPFLKKPGSCLLINHRRALIFFETNHVKKTGIKKVVMNVAASMPPKTPVPMD